MSAHTIDHTSDTTGSIIGTEVIELQALYEIAQLIGSAHDLNTTLSKVLRVLHDILRMERATLLLYDDRLKHLVIRASYGLTQEEILRGVYGLNEGISGKIFKTNSPFAVPDVHSEPLFLNKTQSRKTINKGQLSFIGVPVIVAKKPVGVLTVDRLFGLEISFEEDIRFLTAVATFIAQFIALDQEIKKNEAVLREENISLKEQLRSTFSHHNMIGHCKVMQSVYNAIEKVAPTAATALLLGESGTGKELVAKAIHQASPRQDKAFLKMNCAALPENLLESELFGHEKGAFTGAIAQKKGRFELADKGTLFLDEIGEMPLDLQTKLLRVLQEQQFERLGGSRTISVDVRVIAATNRSLEDAVAQNIFRADLYYRLNVVPILLPPLRDRKEDIPLLLDHFFKESNSKNNRNLKLSKEVLDFMVEYKWPGNVRELQNLVERLVIMAEGDKLRMNDLPSFMLAEAENQLTRDKIATEMNDVNINYPPIQQHTRGQNLKDMERKEIEAALRRHGWVQARAARELGLTQRQIGYKVKKYNLKPPVY